MYGANSHSFYAHDFQPIPATMKSEVDDILIENGLSDSTQTDPRFLGVNFSSLPYDAQQEVGDRIRRLGLAIGINASVQTPEDPDPLDVVAAMQADVESD